MTVSTERFTITESQRVPRAGTAEHLRYLADLQIEPSDSLADPKTFLISTHAATSLARMIFRHASDWPLANNLQASLDTRDPRFTSDQELPLFRASVDLPAPIERDAASKKVRGDEYTPPWPVDHTLPRNIVIHGRPSPDYSYDLVIPIHRVNIYDPSRPLSASYHYKDELTAVYNETATPAHCDVKSKRLLDYNEHNTFIFTSVVQEASEDLLNVANHLRRRPSNALPFKVVDVKWQEFSEADGPDTLIEQRLRALREIKHSPKVLK